MSTKKKYYKLDVIRVLSCLAVLLYHLNILKGGYLAVCTFFVLTGYLSYLSASSKKDFSFKKYYLNRLLKIYLPLIITIFITIAIVSFIPSINWLNLKPETNSVIFGYNNFWQLTANQDYFARHINSPFIHFWYIAILLQFELVFPFIYIFIEKTKEKISKHFPLIVLIILSLLSTVYFFISALNKNIMFTYYNTFTRIFPILIGITLSYIKVNYKDLVPKKFQEKSNWIFLIYTILLVILTVITDSTSCLFSLAMLAFTIITTRLISYSCLAYQKNNTFLTEIINKMSSISYEIYLVQYPLIFFFQFINIPNIYKIIGIILLTFMVALLLNFSTNINKNKRLLRIFCLTILSLISIFGLYKFLLTEDHSLEMKKLEEQLAKNKELIAEKQKLYLEKQNQAQAVWNSTLEDLEKGEENLKNVITNIQIVGVGDSVMLGATPALYQQFPNGYFDAAISRTAWKANGIIKDLNNKNITGEIFLINLGANGDCPDFCKEELMQTIGSKKVFWVNVTNDREVGVNSKLITLSKKHPNIYIIDWNSISANHPEYFVPDGIHLTEVGTKAYASAIYNEIYKVYLNEFEQKKNEILNNYEELQKQKITFYGNSLLSNLYEYIKDDFSEAKIIVNDDFTSETLISELDNSFKDNTLTHRLVFVFDNSSSITDTNFNTIINKYKENDISIITTNENMPETKNFNVKYLNFTRQLKTNTNYLMPDKVHLTNKGNEELSKLLKEILINPPIEEN